MDLTPESYSCVRNTPGVTGFVGATDRADRPAPLSLDEVLKWLAPAVEAEEKKAKPEIKVLDFEVGDSVTVTDGAFASLPAIDQRDQRRPAEAQGAGVHLRPGDAGRAELQPGRQDLDEVAVSGRGANGAPRHLPQEYREMQRSKGYRKAAELIDRTKLYEPAEAIKLAKETSPTKFDATVEVAMRLGVDPRKADQMVRGTVNLPHGTGKTARVIVFAQGAKAEEADAAGADEVGTDELVARIQGGWLDFDAAIATPDQMAKIGRIARILGPRGLMPNPKTGTVTMDVTKAVTDIKGGKITFRVDKHSNLHLIIGKASFSEDAAGGQLRGGPRRGPAGQAVRRQGQVPQEGHRHHDHGPGRPGRPERGAATCANRRRLILTRHSRRSSPVARMPGVPSAATPPRLDSCGGRRACGTGHKGSTTPIAQVRGRRGRDLVAARRVA